MVFDTTDWQGNTTIGPSAAPIFASYTLAAAASQVIIPAVVGLSIVIYGITLMQLDTSGAPLFFSDTTPSTILSYVCKGLGLVSIPLFGIKLPLGLGFEIRSIGAPAMTQGDLVTVIYAQG